MAKPPQKLPMTLETETATISVQSDIARVFNAAPHDVQHVAQTVLAMLLGDGKRSSTEAIQDLQTAIGALGSTIEAMTAEEFIEAVIEQLEDIEDIRDAQEALAEEGETIPWEQVKKNLNL